ncbi:MAG: cytochrome c-type biogenesis protein CcmH [Myxococcota bacterium]
MDRTIPLLAVVLLLGPAASCDTASSDDRGKSRAVQAIVRATNSPFCPGQTLDSCPSPKAAVWRTDINAWIEDGVPAQEVRERLQERVPGFNLEPEPASSGWVIPLVALLVSTLWFVFTARSFRRRGGTPRNESERVHEGFDARLDEELARLD